MPEIGAKGTVVRHQFVSAPDPHTGREVARLTSPLELSHHPYFYNRIVTADDRRLLFASRRGERRQLFLLDLAGGEAVQLTEGAGVHDFGAQLAEDDRSVFFVQGSRIVRLWLDTLAEEVIYETPPGWIANGMPGKSSDDRFLVTVEMNARDRLPEEPPSAAPRVQDPGGTLPRHQQQWALKPRCRIVYVDVERKAGRVIREEGQWLAHPQLRPGDPDTVLYCHEGPWGEVDARLWLVQSDGSRPRCARPREGPEKIGHEYWLPDGSRVAYVFYPQKKGRDGTIRLLEPDTLREQVLMPCSAYDHLVSNRAGTRIAGDGLPPLEPFIYMVDVAARRETKVCWHGTRYTTYGNNQDAHPHPAFSPSGRTLVFTSDRDGLPAIYKVDVSDI